MTDQNISKLLTEALLISLEETFENVQGLYLDRGTSLFETLATVSAAEASQPVSANCASIAAQVEHVTFYMDVILRQIAGDRSPVDWEHIWQTVQVVSEEEWAASQKRLQETAQRIRELVERSSWLEPGAVRGALALLMHNAYHLGEIRQALCTLKG